jgi:cell wall-associated NlpC family hydrolase
MKRIYAVGLASLVAALAVNPGLATAVPAGRPQAIDYVIQRALSQRGVPYVYGGGNAAGPTAGVSQAARSVPLTGTVPDTSLSPGNGTVPPTVSDTGLNPGSNTVPPTGVVGGTNPSPGSGTVPATGTVGFDASGLVQYAFAGVGIKLPRTSGQQCGVGRKIAPAQARRGDLICYGPGGSQSVALYLGNGQMVEATEPAVTVSAARTTNMTPYLTRIID